MRTSMLGLSAAFALTAAAWAPPALACGGVFCDSPPPGQPPMPVDQSGENILFFIDDGFVEAHIQIQYEGDPERFAWLVPLQAEPEITVGSAQLMLNLLNATVPTVTVQPVFDSCGGGSGSSGSVGCGMSSSGSSGADFAAGSPTPGGPKTNDPTVQAQQQVGAFDVTILSGSSQAIESWLVANDFLPDPQAPAIIDDYASRGYVFAAIRLSQAAGLDELHPLVIRYPGSEPCIPLKLTGIAATEDMAVRAFFLGHGRSVPTNYRHVELSFGHLDWNNLGQNYTDLVSRAVDAPVAGGRAFVTEYAGPSSIVPQTGIRGPWSAAVFANADAFSVIAMLTQQSLMSCPSATNCAGLHPQVLPLLRNHLPPPAGVSEAEFWSCVDCHTGQFDAASFDPKAFAADVAERIVGPADHALKMLVTAPYLTRLFTTISPAEMTEDPMFVELPLASSVDVSSSLVANDRLTCDGTRVMQLSDGREVAYGVNWPVLNAPRALLVEEYAADGTRIELVNNRSAIDDAIDASNRTLGYDPAAADRNTLSETHGGGACACNLGATPPHGAGILLLGLLGLVRRAFRHRGRKRG